MLSRRLSGRDVSVVDLDRRLVEDEPVGQDRARRSKTWWQIDRRCPAPPIDAKFGTLATVGWITRQTVTGLTITSAIPPTFDAYATIVDVEPWSESGSAAQDVAIVGHLQRFGPTAWWLGYLDAGGSDVVFPRSRKIKMYADWPYVIVNGDAASALGWRAALPDLPRGPVLVAQHAVG